MRVLRAGLLRVVSRGLLPALAFGALASCSGSSGDALSGLVDTAPPAGFHTGPSHANGPLSLKAAAQSAPVPQEQMRAFLKAHGFRSGYARVWTAGDAFVTTVVYRMGSPRDSAALVDLVRTAFHDAAGGIAEADPAIPGAIDYQFYERPSEGAKYQLCHGIVFAVQEYAELVSGCGTTPPDVLLLDRRAQELRGRTLRLVHGAASGTGPNAGTATSSPSTTLQTGSAP